MKRIRVSKKQKAQIDHIQLIINDFMSSFTYQTETGYFKWKDNLKIGDVLDLVLKYARRYKT